MRTAIEWTDETDNIIVVEGGGWWCRKISPGCGNCFAAKLNQSAFYGGNMLPYTGEVPKLVLRLDILDGWARQRKPKRHFVASMTDIFGEWVPLEWIFKFLDAMRAAPLQTFQLLTKRPGRAAEAIRLWLTARHLETLPPNIQMGTSVEDVPRLSRIAELLTIPAHVRFLSVEPLLESLNLRPWLREEGIHWVIVGGESGPKARPTPLDAVLGIVQQCAEHDVPCFVKQLGARPLVGMHQEENGIVDIVLKLKHPKGGDLNEWPQEFKVRQFPLERMAS